MLIFHKGHTDTTQVYSVTVMTHVKALQAGHSSQGTSEPITPAYSPDMNPIEHLWNQWGRAVLGHTGAYNAKPQTRKSPAIPPGRVGMLNVL